MLAGWSTVLQCRALQVGAKVREQNARGRTRHKCRPAAHFPQSFFLTG